MNKKSIEEVIKRYHELAKAMNEKQSHAKIDISHKIHVIAISEEIKTIFKIIEDVYTYEKDYWIRKIIEKMKEGEPDAFIMSDIPWQKNAYYKRKQRIIEKVYNCCVCMDLVNYDEILNEDIS